MRSKVARTGWQRSVIRLALVYLVIGFSLSSAMNVWGAITGGPSAFVWTGSLKDNLILLFWWFILPALTWPVNLYWTLHHKLFH